MGWEGQLRILGEVALAMLLGAAIGLEREAASKPAGLRTHMLVAGAAALLVGLGEALVPRSAGGSGPIQSDPVRVIEAIISGVSFLGAGTIIRGEQGGRVQGLTTAASLLVAAAVGICVALLQLLLAFGVTALTLLTLRGIAAAEARLGRPQSNEVATGERDARRE